jgi:hypothetical protein
LFGVLYECLEFFMKKKILPLIISNVILFGYSSNSIANCSVSQGSNAYSTAGTRYNVPISCYTNAGWAVPVPANSSGNLTTSTNYDYGSRFYSANNRVSWTHGAVDWVGNYSTPYTTNTPVYAIGDGVVKYVLRSNSTTDNLGRLHIAHTAANGTQFLAIYGHMYASSGLEAGSQVTKGQQLGTLRLAGDPMHLHLELNTNLSTTSFGSIKTGTVDPMQFLVDNPAATTSATNLTYFDGAGSLISPSQSGFGANTDIANMHANPGRTSTAVFQFLNSSDQCHHVDISSSLSEAIIQVKNWSDHEVLTAYKGTLPISVLNKGTWTVVAVTSTQPLTTDYVSVRAKCKTSSDPLTSSYHNRTALDMKLIPLDSDYYWTGTGSIMSFLGSGTGKTSDIVPTFYSHKSLSSFQWYASSSCSKLKISGSGRSGSTSLYGDNEVAIKNWSRNKDGWGGNLCSSLPCTISRPNSIDDFYIVKVKTNANATGGSLYAECTN